MHYFRKGIVQGYYVWCVVLVYLMYANLVEMRAPFCPEYIPVHHFFLVLSSTVFIPYLFLFIINRIARNKKSYQFGAITRPYLGTMLLFGIGCLVDYLV